MRWVPVIVTASAVATLATFAAILAPPATSSAGAHTEYFFANGPDAREVSRAEFEKMQQSGGCGVHSHERLWPDQTLQRVCEL